MRKTMMIAATLLTLGTGAAFANDGNVYVPQAATAQAQQAQVIPPQANAQRTFTASNHQTTTVYDLFARPGYAQGGDR
ncbi:MAG: hypothetical protein J0H67_23475 [Rhodospirillales bacterium]|nr:hypothetical protein [Rhodospirillales bacterium]